MPRQVIVAMLVVLILGILGGTVAVIVSRFRPAGSEPVAERTPNADLPGAATGGQQVADSTDSDQDGLPNAEERQWGTDSNKPDTDGDGYLDGQEVGANHNPTIAGPNDLLPPGFVLPGAQGGQVGTGTQLVDYFSVPDTVIVPDPSQALNPDLYFQESLNVRSQGPNLTDVLRAQVGSDPSQQQIVTFVKAQPIQTALPAVSAEGIKIQENAPPGETRDYLDFVQSLPSGLSALNLSTSLEGLFLENRTDNLLYYIDQLQRHHSRLQNYLHVPAQAVQLHRFVLSYTDVVATLLQSIVTKWPTDRVGALVDMRQLDAIDRQYVPLIETEINRLERVSLQR